MSKIYFFKVIILSVATGFGFGFVPIASGTFGTLPGVAIVWVLVHYCKLSVFWFSLVALLLAIVSIPICDIAENYFGTKDDKRIVADEMLTFPICMVGLPAEPITIAIAFVSARVFDIIKPPPARRLQSLKGGVGIAIDDIIANLYALLFNHIVFWLLNSKEII